MAYQPAGGPSIDGRPELLSPRNLLAILNETFRVYGSNVWRFLALAAVVQVPLVARALMLGQLLGGLPFYIAGTLLYYDLRVRKEDYNLTDLSRELGAAPA